VLTPGDTINYFFCAQDAFGKRNYFTKQLNGEGPPLVTDDVFTAVNTPLEMTCLPANALAGKTNILYVDGYDGRGAQPFFDTAFELLDLQPDRYDILDVSSLSNNGPGSRVSDLFAQIIPYYKTIVWNTGDLPAGLMGDGQLWGPFKSSDTGLLYEFLDQHPDNPGLYLSGDDIAEEWDIYGNYGLLNPTFIEPVLAGPGHTLAGEPLSPLLTAVDTSSCFSHGGISDSLFANGGCPLAGDFDLLHPAGSSVAEVGNPVTGKTYVISQATPNSAGSTARVIFSGFSFHHIRAKNAGFPPARVEHLRDILNCFADSVPAPTTVSSAPMLTNYLDNVYPNPFNSDTTIRYGIKKRAQVSLKIFNVAGQLVKTLVNETQNPAVEYKVRWDGTSNSGQSIASGVYFFRLVTDEFTQSKKMVLLK
jgi:hypothetical protein